MIDGLERLVDDIARLNSKLVLLVGPPGSGKSKLLGQLSARRNAPIVRLGEDLGRLLVPLPASQRHLMAPDLLKELAGEAVGRDLLLWDNIELLFDRTLRLSPLDLMRRHSHGRRVVAAWPGELRDGRLVYAVPGHPEHQNHGTEGWVPFNVG
ncbi:BREX-3 system P-loop-containing protein BrxF [Teichococcus oryzae]|uniref:BREX-3 system P-loop-containing protein BrxF n=1 Tax=Teichococcus oryzae TaxID=1608942 RepID=A0A5B2TB99_9PROT|nr:BREX-3 system P-loop-containing protein BrxF [Pseudoroseomonas oryzae]KAA2211335.1 BREX-3 system P-loop-containing protein BrxF [Pseudoroseomonas oryzae]